MSYLFFSEWLVSAYHNVNNNKVKLYSAHTGCQRRKALRGMRELPWWQAGRRTEGVSAPLAGTTLRQEWLSTDPEQTSLPGTKATR